jgi:hypothetical protein
MNNFYLIENIKCRSIPPAGYIKLGALRYGIRNLSKLNTITTDSNESTNNKQMNVPTSLIMSPSDTVNVKNDYCNDGCCCCISASSIMPSNAGNGKNSRSQLSSMSSE